MDLKEIIKNTSLITGLLIFIGYFQLDAYYTYYYINIAEYIDVSEILTLSLRNLSLLSTIGILYTVFTINWDPFIRQFNLAKEDIIECSNKSSLLKRFKLYRIYILLIFVYLLPLAFMIIFMETTYTIIMLKAILYIMLMFNVLPIFYSEYIIYKYRRTNKFYLTHWFKYIYVFIIVLIFAKQSSEVNIYFTETKNKYSKIEVIFNNGEVIKSNETEYYLGKTNKYFFFYNRKDDLTKIYSNTNVKAFILNYH